MLLSRTRYMQGLNKIRVKKTFTRWHSSAVAECCSGCNSCRRCMRIHPVLGPAQKPCALHTAAQKDNRPASAWPGATSLIAQLQQNLQLSCKLLAGGFWTWVCLSMVECILTWSSASCETSTDLARPLLRLYSRCSWQLLLCRGTCMLTALLILCMVDMLLKWH